MCFIHTPTCLIPGCGELRSSSGLYCDGHSCNHENCDRVIEGSSWCKLHRTCKLQGCDLPRTAKQAGQPGEHCWKHMLRNCSKSGCTKTVDGDKYFCLDHECKAPARKECTAFRMTGTLPMLSILSGLTVRCSHRKSHRRIAWQG